METKDGVYYKIRLYELKKEVVARWSDKNRAFFYNREISKAILTDMAFLPEIPKEGIDKKFPTCEILSIVTEPTAFEQVSGPKIWSN
jgi:hypothetical protein